MIELWTKKSKKSGIWILQSAFTGIDFHIQFWNIPHFTGSFAFMWKNFTSPEWEFTFHFTIPVVGSEVLSFIEVQTKNSFLCYRRLDYHLLAPGLAGEVFLPIKTSLKLTINSPIPNLESPFSPTLPYGSHAAFQISLRFRNLCIAWFLAALALGRKDSLLPFGTHYHTSFVALKIFFF